MHLIKIEKDIEKGNRQKKRKMEKKQTTKNVLINKLVENIKNENPTNYATLEPDNTSGC